MGPGPPPLGAIFFKKYIFLFIFLFFPIFKI